MEECGHGSITDNFLQSDLLLCSLMFPLACVFTVADCPVYSDAPFSFVFYNIESTYEAYNKDG